MFHPSAPDLAAGRLGTPRLHWSVAPRAVRDGLAPQEEHAPDESAPRAAHETTPCSAYDDALLAQRRTSRRRLQRRGCIHMSSPSTQCVVQPVRRDDASPRHVSRRVLQEVVYVPRFDANSVATSLIHLSFSTGRTCLSHS